MKKIQLITSLTMALACITLSSCGTVGSVLKVPGNLLKSVGRTVGMPVNHSADPATEQPSVEVIGDGVIQQLD